MKIVIGCDNAAFDYKEILKADLEADERVSEVIDIGVDSGTNPEFYPDVAIRGAEMIRDGHADRALLLCGTGLGVAISANKVAGVRAVTAHDIYSVERSVKSNNAQVLCMGQRVVGIELARVLAKAWVGYQFDPTSPSNDKVRALLDYEGCS